MDQTIRDRVRRLLVETELASPHVIADRILAELDDAELRDALRECLQGYVRTTMSGEYSFHRRPEPTMFEAADESTDSAAQSGTVGSSRSDRWESARGVFRAPKFVGMWKQLGDCTLEDVEYLVSDRYERSKELAARADRFAALRDLMVRRGVARVRDLDEDEVEEILK